MISANGGVNGGHVSVAPWGPGHWPRHGRRAPRQALPRQALPQQALPRQGAGVRLESDGARRLLRRSDDPVVHVLNDTALALWQQCDGSTTPEEMTTGICELFAVDRDEAAASVEQTLAEFSRLGLLDWAADSQRGTWSS